MRTNDVEAGAKGTAEQSAWRAAVRGPLPPGHTVVSITITAAWETT